MEDNHPKNGAKEDLAQVLADAREEAQVLRRAGNAGQADHLDGILNRIREAGEGFIVWRSEEDAALKSGLSVRALRRRFRDLLDTGLARYGLRGKREYLDCAIPNRPEIRAARNRGLAA